MTQVELAAEMDIDVRTIKNIESGKYNPTLVVILGLASALEVKVSELFK
ncbi:MAG: helix-turn-helix transcriptional regulator [Bacteroidetes bacterium]|nr:helix-turn-helix transcriptional regulator [Bacteroidota bacterium]